MPSGQGPTRSGSRGSGLRPAPQRRPAERRLDHPGRPAPTRTRVEGPATRTEAPAAGVRRRVGPARRTRAPRRPRRVSGRAAALGLLLVAFVLAYAYPVRVYLSQQAEIAQLESAQAEQRGRIADLRARIARWDDPDFVIRQARVRLQLVRRGELMYVVDPDPSQTSRPDQTGAGGWFPTLWSSVQGADDPDGS